MIPTIQLHGPMDAVTGGSGKILRLREQSDGPPDAREALLWDHPSLPPAGYGAYIGRRRLPEVPITVDPPPIVAHVGPTWDHLVPGDVIRIDPARQSLAVRYRIGSQSNALLATEQCNSACVMCSQPPKDALDRHWVDEALTVVSLMDARTQNLGISGGEPTLLGDDLQRLLRHIRAHLPQVALHVLSNGRLFAYRSRATAFAEAMPRDTMVGVPLYADVPAVHDHVVQARGAFDQTIRGLIHLAAAGVPIELRIVLHRLTIPRLPELGAFIARNLPFVRQVCFMGMEHMGYAKTNLRSLWVDPVDYQAALASAISSLRGVTTPRIYNLPTCVVRDDLRAFATPSISDWKTKYIAACADCACRATCGGIFASQDGTVSRGIHSIRPLPACEIT